MAAALGAIFALLLPAAPARAAFKTFVSSTGGGTVCTFAAPCANFQDAHDTTDVIEQIACLDSGNFGAAVISRSITIDCAGTSASTTFRGVQGAVGARFPAGGERHDHQEQCPSSLDRSP
jgi:hypothetical protein